MSLSKILNLDDENIEVEDEVTLREIIVARIIPQYEEHEEDEKAAELPAMIDPALHGLMLLLSFREQELNVNSMDITILTRIERSLQQQAEYKKR
ncbi:unnamed protein product [Blumeria hordei]|uniref:Uncharacterized protein n=1 Tax=Blumeria hordei TaxID=2867405 RepID=A0A383V2Q8_BLUHO|nr:unnamed protein product [Blumeria hordei]